MTVAAKTAARFLATEMLRRQFENNINPSNTSYPGPTDGILTLDATDPLLNTTNVTKTYGAAEGIRYCLIAVHTY